MPQPRTLANETPLPDAPETPGAGPVTSYWIGDFEYWSRSTEKSTLIVRKGSLGLNVALVAEIKRHNNDVVPDRWKVGIDKKRGLIEAKPDPHGLKLSVNKKSSGYCIANRRMVEWLLRSGVPAKQPIEAHWQPQTQSIVGRYAPAVSKSEVSA